MKFPRFVQVDGLVQDAIRQGAHVVTGGSRHTHGPLFYQPTLLQNVTSDMDIAREEIFGPVAAVQRYKINICSDIGM